MRAPPPLLPPFLPRLPVNAGRWCQTTLIVPPSMDRFPVLTPALLIATPRTSCGGDNAALVRSTCCCPTTEKGAGCQPMHPESCTVPFGIIRQEFGGRSSKISPCITLQSYCLCPLWLNPRPPPPPPPPSGRWLYAPPPQTFPRTAVTTAHDLKLNLWQRLAAPCWTA